MAALSDANSKRQSTRRSVEEYGDRLRALIRHENDVTNHRTTWLLVIQGLLATAASALIKEHPILVLGIAAVGVAVTISIGHTLQNSLDSRAYLKALWSSKLEAKGLAIEEMLPIDGAFSGNKAIRWLLPSEFLPPVIVLAWIGLVVYVFARRMI